MGLNTRPTDELLKRYCFLANTRGIIPNPVNATRVDIGGDVAGNASTAFYIVPGGCVAFISSIALEVCCGATFGAAFLRVKNAAGVVQYYMAIIYLVAANTRGHVDRYFCPAVEVAAEGYVEVVTTAATLSGRADINGWRETV